MAILFDAIAATLTLNLNWWVWIIMNNLFWVFGVMAAAYFFYGRKKMLSDFIMAVFLIWSALDFSALSGWVILSGTFLALLYLSRLALVGFVENVPSMQKKLPFIISLQFIVVLVIYNIFMR